MMLSRISVVVVSLALAGCVASDVTPLAKDTIRIDVEAAPVCGKGGSRRIASKRAAIETINRGYDRFIVLDSYSTSDRRVVSRTPLYVSGNAVYGGQPIYGGSHDSGLIVQMFTYSDPRGRNALDARVQLGDDWETVVKERVATC